MTLSYILFIHSSLLITFSPQSSGMLLFQTIVILHYKSNTRLVSHLKNCEILAGNWTRTNFLNRLHICNTFRLVVFIRIREGTPWAAWNWKLTVCFLHFFTPSSQNFAPLDLAEDETISHEEQHKVHRSCTGMSRKQVHCFHGQLFLR